MYNEFHDRISREQNILIFNIPDSAHEVSSDSKSISDELLKDLSLSNTIVVHATRLGNFGHKPRPILLKLESLSDVKNVLKSKSKLRHIDRWRQISISEDKTATQRAHMKQLRTDLARKRDSGDTNWFIKYNKGIPFLMKKN